MYNKNYNRYLLIFMIISIISFCFINNSKANEIEELRLITSLEGEEIWDNYIGIPDNSRILKNNEVLLGGYIIKGYSFNIEASRSEQFEV